MQLLQQSGQQHIQTQNIADDKGWQRIRAVPDTSG